MAAVGVVIFLRKHLTIPRPERVIAQPPSRKSATQPVVSVIIPCYNYANFLPESIGSSLSQDGVLVEVIVVDDASTDESVAVVEKFMSVNSRVKLVRHETNKGHVVAYNDGFSISTGDYVVRLDADDLLTAGSLSRAVAIFEAMPSVGLVYGNPRHFVGETPTSARTRPSSWTVWRGHDWLARRCQVGVNCITTPEAIIRGSIARRIGGLDLRLAYAQDMEMWLRVAAVSDVARVNGVDQAFHRDHATSMSATVGSGILRDLEERRRVFDVLFEGQGSTLSDAAELHETARIALAREALDRACRAYDRGQTARSAVDDYVAYAIDVYPRSRELKEWRALSRRRAIGTRLAPKMPQFFARAILRRAHDEASHVYWRYTGT
jgi:glycosyltransferase involved in cell wall biosynthesis